MGLPDIPLPEWLPDLAPIGTNAGQTISGVVPRADGYGPFKSLQSFTQALPNAAPCRGYFFARNSDDSIAVFAGTSTRLYKLDNTTFSWTDVSKGATTYSALVDSDNWQFRQFQNLVIAVQINTVPQKFDLSGPGPFADLGGSPPQASHAAVINGFVVLTGLLSNARRAQWSDLFAPETWTAGVGLSDFQDFADGGTCHGISGGDTYGLLFQDEVVRSIVYAPGSPLSFQIYKLAQQETLFGQYSVIEAGDRTFYCAASGFKEQQASGSPMSIGKEKVDRTFSADVDQSNLQLLIGAVDPQSTRVFWAYKSKSGLANQFDKVLLYDWVLKKWALLPIMGQYLTALAKPGVTLEQLDAIAPTPLNVTGTADNGAGRIRLTLNALSNASFNIVGQNFIVVYGVGGTTEANGTWTFTVVDSTHIDLQRNQATGNLSAYANAWTAGGNIGGSLDALTFSLDSVSQSTTAALSAFSTASTLGFFNGANIEAIVETADQDGDGQHIFVSGVRPITDSVDVLASCGYRLRPQDAVTYTGESGIDYTGNCSLLAEGRYVRGRCRIPAGSDWSYVKAMQPDGDLAGDS
jgi:hypothetical protein